MSLLQEEAEAAHAATEALQTGLSLETDGGEENLEDAQRGTTIVTMLRTINVLVDSMDEAPSVLLAVPPPIGPIMEVILKNVLIGAPAHGAPPGTHPVPRAHRALSSGEAAGL